VLRVIAYERIDYCTRHPVDGNIAWRESIGITQGQSAYFLIVILPSLIKIFSPPLSTTSPPLVFTVQGAEP
jgi:hypothetical protein